MQSLSIIWEVKDGISGTKLYSSSFDVAFGDLKSDGTFSLEYPIFPSVPNGEVEITEVRVQDIYGNVTILSTPDQLESINSLIPNKTFLQNPSASDTTPPEINITELFHAHREEPNNNWSNYGNYLEVMKTQDMQSLSIIWRLKIFLELNSTRLVST